MNRLAAALSLISTAAGLCFAHSIQVFAGAAPRGDGGPALKARFTNPVGLAVKKSGWWRPTEISVQLDAVPDFTTVTGDALYPQDYDFCVLQ
jgi:hypothetical protein